MTYRVLDLAKLLGGKLEGDPEVLISGVARIEDARPGEITFLANPKYERFLATTQASAVLVSPQQQKGAGTVIRVPDPYSAFAHLLTLFCPPEKQPDEGVHSTACLGADIKMGSRVHIGAQVVIGEGCILGDDVTVYPGVLIGDRVSIGGKTTIRAGVSIRSGVQIGCQVTIQDNAVIGSEGFGFAPKEDGDYEKIPQVGTVIIEDDVEIGAGCTIDRATMGATRIEKGAKLDNLIQVAHNVVIGSNTVIAAQTGISGSTKIGEKCMIGGQVGFVGHITLGGGSKVGAQSGISKSFPAGSTISGSLAKPHREELLIQASQKKLPELLKRVDRLEKEITQLRSELKEK